MRLCNTRDAFVLLTQKLYLLSLSLSLIFHAHNFNAGKVLLKEHARYEVLKYETHQQLALSNQKLVPVDGEKAKRLEEEALNNCLELAKGMRDDASGAVTKTERDEWRLRVAFTLLQMGEMHLRNENFSRSERSFGSAFQAVEHAERELVKRKASGSGNSASVSAKKRREEDREEEALLMREEKDGLTRFKLTVALADLERAILQRANGEEPSRVSKAMKKAEEIAKDVHAMDEHARELFQFSSLRCASKIEEGDVASALKGASDLRKRCDYHKKRMVAHFEETLFVERLLVKAGVIDWRTKEKKSTTTATKKSPFALLNETAKEWIPERQVIARAEILLAETSRKSGSTKETAQRLREVKKMLDEGLEELGISALGLPYKEEDGDVEIGKNAKTDGAVKKRVQNEDEKEEDGEKAKQDDEEEMDVDEKDVEEEETPKATRSGRRSTRGGKSTPRSDSKPSKKIPATESTKKKRAAKTKEVVVQKKSKPEPEQQQQEPPKRERIWVMKEENLGPRSSCDALPFFTLRCNCNELLASMYLTAGDYPKAVVEANELDATVSTYPVTLSSLVAHCEMVRGHAFYSMGKFHDSVKAFTKAAEGAKTPSFRDVATLCAALGELASGGTKGASKALDLAQPICRRHEDFLQNEEEQEKRKKKEEESGAKGNEANGGDDGDENDDDDDDDENSFRPSLTDRAVALFVSGFAFLERGNQDGAKSRLSSALKLAHAKTKDTQLVAACLRALGSIASERSAPNEQQQALDMLQSAFTLSKAQDDLDGQVDALRNLVASHEKKGSNEKEKKTLSDYLQKKENQMEEGLNKLKLEENKINVLLLEKGLKDLMNE